jgi:hypothetical protein
LATGTGQTWPHIKVDLHADEYQAALDGDHDVASLFRGFKKYQAFLRKGWRGFDEPPELLT